MKKPQFTPAVRDAIERIELRTEAQVVGMQLVLVVSVGLFYLLSPKGFGGRPVPFQPVPLALFAFTALLIARAWLIRRGRIPQWISSFFVIADMVMLSALIFSYHIQYSAPISISLKAPTFIFFFIFTILASLRYNVLNVILAGSTALLAWAGITFYAFTSGAEITGSYVEYATTGKILLGVEIEKLLALALSSSLLTLGVSRSRQLLATSERQTASVNSLSTFFSPKVAERITDSSQLRPGIGSLRRAAIVTVDLRNFSTYSTQMKPDLIMLTLSDYQSLLTPIILQNGGSIDKFLGDGILIHFGAVDDNEKYVGDALRVGELIVQKLREWVDDRERAKLPKLDFGVSVTHGMVVFGTVGDENRLEFTVVGEAVNLCVKLEKMNKVCDTHLLTPESTYLMALEQGYKPENIRFHRFINQRVDGIPNSSNLVGSLRDNKK